MKNQSKIKVRHSFPKNVKFHFSLVFGQILRFSGPILESKSMRAIFQKKGKKMFKKDKIFENIGKNVQNLKIFLKRASDCVR